MLKWYLPTFYGDIQLESQDRQHTKVTFEKLTPEEVVAMRALLNHATQKGWATSELCRSQLKTLGTLHEKPQELWLNAQLTAVQKVLSKPLKPGRKQVSAVRFRNGAIEELTSANIGFIEAEAAVVEEKDEPIKKAKGTVATTVAAPVIGCPAPDFERAELRATQVLEAFLTEGQLADFRSDQAFVARGAQTGDQYMIVSRHAKTRLGQTNRSLYNLTTKSPLCVHDWTVPAAEEMLALFLMVALPGRESFVRMLPEDGFEHPELILGADDDWPVVPAIYPMPVIRACRINEGEN